MEENINDQILKVIDQYEKDLSWKSSGNIENKVSHVLSQYRQIADNAIYQAKQYLEDTKTQFKALEIVVEGLTDEGMNHGQKRVIANHIIRMLRSMVDKLDQVEYEYNTQFVDRFNFFRSGTPEKRVYEERRELKQKVEQTDKILKTLEEVHPDIYKALTDKSDEIPF